VAQYVTERYAATIQFRRGPPPVTTQQSTTAETRAERTMSLYRSLLANLLTRAEGQDRRDEPAIGLAFARLVDSLGADLVQLYQDEAAGRLSDSDRRIVLPALERMRNVLRRAHRRTLSLRDTLHKALNAAAPSAS